MQQCVVRMLFALRAMADARGRASSIDRRTRLDRGQERGRWRWCPRATATCSDKKAFAHVATVGRDGTPQVTPVWVDYDGTHVRFNTARGRVKDKNLQRNPRIALSVQDPDNPYRYLQVRGRVVEMTEKGADDAHRHARQEVHGPGSIRPPPARRGARHRQGPAREDPEHGMSDPVPDPRAHDPARGDLEGLRRPDGSSATLSWRIADRERIGLVGPTAPARRRSVGFWPASRSRTPGASSRPRETTVGYLPQEAAGQPEWLRARRGARRLRRRLAGRARDGGSRGAARGGGRRRRAATR